ncbi:hypothetical protein LSUB1_G003127 [Lachnellula subtilissima]|uniref:Geranylgeranyl pyrophosphate synthetase n=1 Tax=Lachnellula subtilissima TaxID=602034 RepID=A0A8H8RXG6_9HELO|nr:hypothetical protein LSUB1_G003127 [Lachnellula subtilissima]
MSSQEFRRGNNLRGARGNRRARGGWRGSSHTSASTPQKQPRANEPFGPRIDSFTTKQLLIEEESPEIENVKYVGSYNWLNDSSAIILVPGSPPAWTPLAVDGKLRPDSEPVYRDINAARYAAYPMEPAVRSVLAMQPLSELPFVDVFGCGSTFGNLLRCARSQPKPFRFDVDVIGDTVFMVRREETPTEMITDLQGYGHTFPEAYTSWDANVRNSTSHQRIVSYAFGGMQFFIRSETDGYLRDSSTGSPSLKKAQKEASIDDVLDGLGIDARQPVGGSAVTIQEQGTPIPQDAIFDIKTRASYREYNMEDILPRLWMNQTPNFLLAYHEFGKFTNPKVKSVRDSVLEWQTDNASDLARFHALVRRIVDVVRDSDGQQFEISCDGQGDLCITKQIAEGREALPTDLSGLWQSI